jgi:CDP-diacylglycerol--serine O-phosphatidyltransferase
MVAKKQNADSDNETNQLKIYLLPNLMTAGNLFCGFLALTKIVEADIASADFNATIRQALFYILLACIFDFLDGRVARLVDAESPFGREFDSLADIISFGVAPAFLVHRVVLKDIFQSVPELGWFIASIFLICGAFRLARFNCLAELPDASGNKEFLGFPIPSAAGLVASLTLFIMWGEDQAFKQGNWRFVLPVLLLFLSFMMVSEVRYPSFKKVNWRARRPFTKMVLVILVVGSFFILQNKILPIGLPLLFSGYLIYGFIRPHISKRMLAEIEEDGDDDSDSDFELRSERSERTKKNQNN